MHSSLLLRSLLPLVLLLSPRGAWAAPLQDSWEQRLERFFYDAPTEEMRCLTPLLAHGRLAPERLEPEVAWELEAFLLRPTDGSEVVGGVDVSYDGYSAHTIVSTSSPPFRIWYALDSDAAVSLVDVSPANQVPDYVDQVASTLQNVYQSLVVTQGYQAPPGDGTVGGGTNLYDVYLTELSPARVYGYAAPEACAGSPLTCTSYLVLDNDYSESIYTTKGLSALQVTAAHEYFHAIHFAYELEENFWWLEQTATWVEDVLYDTVNDYVAYLPHHANQPYLPLTVEDGKHEYANVVWPTWLSESYGSTVVREVFEEVGAVAGDNTLEAIITILEAEDTTLADDLLVHQTHNQNRFRYEEGSLFWGSVSDLVPAVTVKAYPWQVQATQLPNGVLGSLSAQFFRLEPPSGTAHNTLELTVDGDDVAGFGAAVVVQTACGTRYELPIHLDSSNAGLISIPEFVASSVTSVTGVVVNGCRECSGVKYSLSALLVSGAAGTDADSDCVLPILEGGADCDDASAARGPFADEVADGVDNDCDGGFDEGAGIPVLFPTPLTYVQGQDFELKVKSRYLEIYDGVTFSLGRKGGSVTDIALLNSQEALLHGMIGILAPEETAVSATNQDARGSGVLYIGESHKEELLLNREVSGSLVEPGAFALFAVSSQEARTFLAKATSTGSVPFVPELRWIDEDGFTELFRSENAAGLEAPVGTVYLRVSDAGGGGGSGYHFELFLSEGCAEDEDSDGFITAICPGGTDCNDRNAAVSPVGLEVPYDGIDQDCVGGDLTDQDSDGFDAARAGGADCNDLDPEVNPEAVEVCDGVDNDCDGLANEGMSECTQEVCDGMDNDADGEIDEGFDADGIGGADCIDNDGDTFSELEGDCNDTQASISPLGSDIPYDGVDQDCSGGDLADLDQDGYLSTEVQGDDCNDFNAFTHPDALEKCDHTDNDCDGAVDEGTDYDGIGGSDCDDDDLDGTTELEGDCRDDDPAIGPEADEVPYDGIDQDCTGEDLLDVDGDGYTALEVGGTDCVDTSAISYPRANEICDGLDNDCDSLTDEGYDADGLGGADCIDNDGDGRTEGQGDCDDGDASIGPNQLEVCDAVDNDCDNLIDEGTDLDGLGGSDCTDEDGDTYSEDEGDCQDEDPSIYPDAQESCDQVDSNCDGSSDLEFDDDGIGGSDCYDDDHDGYTELAGDCDDEDFYVNPGRKEIAYNGVDDDCKEGDLVDVDGDLHTAVEAGGDDCDDENPKAYPGAMEIAYNGVDEDCSGSDYQDGDLDGFAGESAGGQDCDDFNPYVYPGAEEIPYNGVDDDCDGTDLADADGDLFNGVEAGGEDCDDSNPFINPFATEVPYDGIDQDCSGYDLTDVDDDGYDAIEVGGEDCDDRNSDVRPLTYDFCGDGLDNDCDGTVDNHCDSAVGSCSCDTDAPGGSSAPWALGLIVAGLVLRRRRISRAER